MGGLRAVRRLDERARPAVPQPTLRPAVHPGQAREPGERRCPLAARRGTLALSGTSGRGGLEPRQETGERLRAHRDLQRPGRSTARDDDVAGVQRVRLHTRRITSSDVLELSTPVGQAGPRCQREHPKPLEVVPRVATHPQNPSASGPSGPDADTELEGSAVSGDPAAAHHQCKAVEQQQEQQDSGGVPQPLPQRHLSPTFACARDQDALSAARTRASAHAASAFCRASSSLAPSDLHQSKSARAFSRSMSCDISACSARIEIRLLATDRKPASTAATQVSSSEVVTSTIPCTINDSPGAWCGRMPTSPSVVRAITILASPDHTSRSAATSWTCIRSSLTRTPQRFFWMSAHFFSTSSRPPHMKNACSATWS